MPLIAAATGTAFTFTVAVGDTIEGQPIASTPERLYTVVVTGDAATLASVDDDRDAALLHV